MKIDNNTGKIFFKHYKVEEKIGEGSFGKIYICSDIELENNHNDNNIINSKINNIIFNNDNQTTKFALKLEKKQFQSLLDVETNILMHLKGFGIPAVITHGSNSVYNLLLMELLGQTLEELFEKNNKKFSIKTVALIALQIINRLEFIHNKYIIHRDIKPENFAIGKNDKENIIYIFDFGLSKKYFSTKTNTHIKYKINKKLTGTARYASINALKGGEQSRRDDLESLGYMLIYFLKGSLPWQGLKLNKTEDRYKKILEVKINTSSEELCKGFPNEFNEYIKYTRNLGFEAKPDYNYLRGLMMNVLENLGEKYDYWFDWNKEKPSVNKNYVDEDFKYFGCGNVDNIEFDKNNINNNNIIKLNNDKNNNNIIIGNNDLNKIDIDNNIKDLNNNNSNNNNNNNNNKKENKLKKMKNKIVKKCQIF